MKFLFWCPTKSRTVRTDFNGARRRPRPSCCRKRVSDWVGRSIRRVSTLGISTPSLNRSTVKIVVSSCASSARFFMTSARRSAESVPTKKSAGIPTSLNFCAMYSACFTLTQKPSAFMRRGLSTFSRSSSTMMRRRRSASSLVYRFSRAFSSYLPPRTLMRRRSVPSAIPKYWKGTRRWSSSASHRRIEVAT